MSRINKWIFKDFKEDIQNYNFQKTLPFCTFSSIKNIDYDLIGEVLDFLKYDRDKFISIGNIQAPFGITIEPENNHVLNQLLNSIEFSFVLTKDISEINYIIKSILAGIIPICHKDLLYLKQMGLQEYSVYPFKNNIVDKILYMMYHKNSYHYNTYWLSWKYNNQIKKWNRNRKYEQYT